MSRRISSREWGDLPCQPTMTESPSTPSLAAVLLQLLDRLSDILRGLAARLALSTYQSGKVILVSHRLDGLVSCRAPSAMRWPPVGERLASRRRTRSSSWPTPPSSRELSAQARGLRRLYLRARSTSRATMAIHDMAWGATGGSTRSTPSAPGLSAIEDRYSFTPVWKPPVHPPTLAADHCHLNGLALADGRPRYVTALGTTDTAQGWRENKLEGGVLMEIDSGENPARGPLDAAFAGARRGRLFLLNSAACELLVVDPERRTSEVVGRLPGFARGLAVAGDYLFVGLSHLRHDHKVFGDLPIARAEGSTAASSASTSRAAGLPASCAICATCKEIYDVQFLPGLLRPGILAPATRCTAAPSPPPASLFGAKSSARPDPAPTDRWKRHERRELELGARPRALKHTAASDR